MRAGAVSGLTVTTVYLVQAKHQITCCKVGTWSTCELEFRPKGERKERERERMCVCVCDGSASRLTNTERNETRTKRKGGKTRTQNRWRSLPARETLGGFSAACLRLPVLRADLYSSCSYLHSRLRRILNNEKKGEIEEWRWQHPVLAALWHRRCRARASDVSAMGQTGRFRA